jgi:hypothetical protein
LERLVFVLLVYLPKAELAAIIVVFITTFTVFTNNVLTVIDENCLIVVSAIADNVARALVTEQLHWECEALQLDWLEHNIHRWERCGCLGVTKLDATLDEFYLTVR